MQVLLALSRAIDGATGRIGRSVAWLVIAAAVISAGNAIIRKLFDTSSNAWLELQWWLFGLVFLLAAPWTLASNEHIRIDIVSSRLSQKARNIIEVVGHALFLLPVSAVMVATSWPFFLRSAPSLEETGRWLASFEITRLGSWLAALVGLGEQSQNAGGLPQWPIKALIPLAFALLFGQGVSELIKRIAIMRGDLDEPSRGGGYHEAVVEMPERREGS